MARGLDQILTELNSVYAPQKQQYEQQIAGVDPQIQAEQAGLDAAKTDAFNQITTGANRRGLLFSGIPVSEQAKYLGSTYLPSIANLKGRYAQQKFNLTDALNQIGQKQYSEATGIYQNEQAQAERQRQFDLQLAADRETAALNRAASERAAAASSAPFQLSGGATTPAGGQVKSAVYENLAKKPTLRDVWQQQANAGDYNARVALNYAGNDGRYDGKVNNINEYNILKQLGIQGNYFAPGMNVPLNQEQITIVPWSQPSTSGLRVTNQAAPTLRVR